MLRLYLLLPILAATFPLLAKEGEPAISPSPINSLPPNPVSDLIRQLPSSELQEAIGQLRSNYIDPAALKNPEIDETALESLVARFGPGAMIQTKEEVEQPLQFRPFKAELLYSQFVYIRLGGVTQNTLTQLDAALNDFRNATGLVLDLRTMQQTSDYPLAAAIASRFVPKGQPIFKLVREAQEKPFVTNVDPLFSGPIMVLVDHADAGVSETVAAVLRSKVHALIIGEKTSGRAVEYTQFPIGKRLLLSVATHQIQVPGQPSIFPNGLSPDIVVPIPDGEETNILRLGDTKGIFDLIRDEERPHTNEAALVAGKSPDIDAYEADQTAGGNRDRVKPKDTVIQRALDVLTAISIYRGK
jgi:hypothetical protein